MHNSVRRLVGIQWIPRPALLVAHNTRGQGSLGAQSGLSGHMDVLRRLRKIYDDAKKVSKKRSRSLRHRQYANLLARIDRIIARYADDPVLEKFMGKLGNAGSDLFRFVLNPNIQPTNNAAERGLREIVVHRKYGAA